jgi:hypothetical protein
MYSSDDELARIAGDFLAEGLRTSERCWYVPASEPNEFYDVRVRGFRAVQSATVQATLERLDSDLNDLRELPCDRAQDWRRRS